MIHVLYGDKLTIGHQFIIKKIHEKLIKVSSLICNWEELLQKKRKKNKEK